MQSSVKCKAFSSKNACTAPVLFNFHDGRFGLVLIALHVLPSYFLKHANHDLL